MKAAKRFREEFGERGMIYRCVVSYRGFYQVAMYRNSAATGERYFVGYV